MNPFFKMPGSERLPPAFLALVCLATTQPSIAAEHNLATVATPAADSHDAMIEDLKFLSSDELQGRSSVDSKILQAADYVAGRFRGLGLDTALFDDSPLQFLDISVGPRITSNEANFLVLEKGFQQPGGPADTDLLTLNRDFSPLAIGASHQTAQGELVWVGYGIRAPEHDYDDYADVDVHGKIVMMLRKEPGANNPASPFDGIQNTRHAFFETKVATAIDAGAEAVLIVNDRASMNALIAAVEERRKGEQERLEKIRDRRMALPAEATNAREKLGEQITQIEAMLAESDAQETATRGLLGVVEAGIQAKRGASRLENADEGETRPPIPVLSVSRLLANRLLSGRLQAFETEIDSDWRPRSIELPEVRLRVGVELTPPTVRSPNVVGTLPGRGNLADETVVIGAHFDHVGMGEFGSLAPGTLAIHNGADDNASGTSAMLRVAGNLVRYFSSESAPTDHRRIVFIAFTGEERGLLGSKHYIKQPRYPLSSTVAMINMDMVGRLRDNELTIYGTGSSAGFKSLLMEVNESAKFNLLQVESGYGPSDHSTFYEAGIPVLFFFTGLHTDYHRPSDDFDKLNLIGMDRITDTISQVSERLATVPERPVYEETEKNVQIRRQLTVSMGVTLSQQPGEVVLSSILADGPAHQAGLLERDRLLKVGKQSVQRIEDVMEQLRRRSPGDVLRVQISRDTKEFDFDVRLQSR